MSNERIKTIEKAFDDIENINSSSSVGIINAIESTIEDIDKGKIRVAEKISGEWTIRTGGIK
jgi:2,3,4,5-tetrahydropyridine-2-carboxylate N-succinyltransferase